MKAAARFGHKNSPFFGFLFNKAEDGPLTFFRVKASDLSEKEKDGSRQKRTERGKKFLRVGNCAEDPLHLNHLQRRPIISKVGRPCAVFQQKAFVAAIVGFAHRCVDADIGRDAGQNKVGDPLFRKMRSRSVA